MTQDEFNDWVASIEAAQAQPKLLNEAEHRLQERMQDEAGSVKNDQRPN